MHKELRSTLIKSLKRILQRRRYLLFNKFKQSLAQTTLLSMGIRISLVIIIAAFFSYHHIVGILQQETLDKLKNYITERVEKESTIFKLAEDNHAVFKQAFLSAWTHRESAQPTPHFEQLFTLQADGTTRLIQKAFTGYPRISVTGDYLGQSKWISGFVSQNAPVESTEFRNRLLLSYELVDTFGLAWSNRFANTYVSMPEGVNIVYWPELNWALSANADLDIPNEEWVYIANKANNPTRESAWTGLYYDQTANEWMVSCETPVDDSKGRHLITIGHDILLNNVFQRVFDNHLEGAHNFIVRADGRLIAHPEHVKELRESKGLTSIDELDEPAASQFKAIKSVMALHGEQAQITFDEKTESFLAFDYIEGPEWIFVTVYPKALLSSPALDAALYIFVLGLISLLLELVMLYFVLKKKVLKPMNKFEQASVLVQQGKYDLHPTLDSSVRLHKDEVGRLAATMISMADWINEHNSDLENQIKHRTKQLEDAKQYAEEQARTDPLTSISNRRAFFEVGPFTFNTAKRNKQPLSIVMMDIDKFKLVNDIYGHSVGDEVLRECAAALVARLRPSDLCARLGGEEFGFLLPMTDLAGAAFVAEKIREQLKTIKFNHNGKYFQVTASFGAAELNNTHIKLEDLLKDADTALYEAKGSGRDRVVKFRDVEIL